MKELRYNDKLWFGKHRGSRVCDVIKGDPSFIKKIVDKGKVKLDQKTQKLFNDRIGYKPLAGIGRGPDNLAGRGLDNMINGNIINIGRDNAIFVQFVSSLNDEMSVRRNITILTVELFRKMPHFNREVISHVANTIIRKLLNTQLIEEPLKLKIVCNNPNADIFDDENIILYIDMVNGTPIASFNLR
jgi:hypothetical protein